MPPVLSRREVRHTRAASGGAYVRVLGRRGLQMVAAVVLTLLLLPTSIGERTAGLSARPPSLAPAGIYSTDLTGFPKWRGMLARFSLELSDPAGADVRTWRSFAAALSPGDRLAQLRAVNTAVNAYPYISDVVNWGKADFWETPMEFLQRAGDCEDFAVTKYMLLRALGVAVDDMRVTVVDDPHLGVTHAVLLVTTGDRYYVLDNLTNEVVPESAMPFYRPIYSINEHGWWSYAASPAFAELLKTQHRTITWTEAVSAAGEGHAE
jgi:predicted transglutaminase-like cysteine proteinase